MVYQLSVYPHFLTGDGPVGYTVYHFQRHSYLVSFCLHLELRYPMVSIEDPFDQDDWDGYRPFTAAVGDKARDGDYEIDAFLAVETS